MTSLNDQMPLPAGKLPPEALAGILELTGELPREVVVPPALGEDSAVLRLPGGLMAVATDPITFPTPRPGHFAVAVNANDIAVSGARPEYFTLTLLLPEGATAADARTIVGQAVATGRELGAVLIGGHTEITSSVVVPVLSLTMFGRLLRDTPLRTGGAEAGDRVLQVNPYALEGTAILASERRDQLRDKVSAEDLARAEALLDEPGICVVRPALLVAEHAGIHAMHDPTEGGIATGLREMAEASGLGLRLQASALHRLPVTERVCAPLGIDPLGLISSGCLLIAVAPDAAAWACGALSAAGYPVADIGTFTADPAMVLVDDDREWALPTFAVDELAAK
jgi:hydrogenase maturation factor